ncbi:hypothetical protein G4B88_001915 [Cannabis sativa]|uniref:HMG box domain-containing protein n=1 Tax=Cannabis sativa TaxID=3483 RepID=A0A7J6HE90_CANSA|nr:hypothetical protein G4B88_001915 [Cannabis sativa]
MSSLFFLLLLLTTLQPSYFFIVVRDRIPITCFSIVLLLQQTITTMQAIGILIQSNGQWDGMRTRITLESIVDDSDSDATDSEGEKENDIIKEPSSSKKKSEDGDEDGPEKKKQKKKKKKKDPSAPRRAMSGFMFFSQMERENVKKTNPGISFPEVGRVLGDKWKRMFVEEKEPFQASARQDKKRYQEEISGYKNAQPMKVDSGNILDTE